MISDGTGRLMQISTFQPMARGGAILIAKVQKLP